MSSSDAAITSGIRFAMRRAGLAVWRGIYRLVAALLASLLLLLGGFIPVLRRRLDGPLDGFGEAVAILGGAWGEPNGPRDPDAELGPSLARGDAPGLFEEVASICRQLGIDPPHQVRLHGLPVCCLVAWEPRGSRQALVVGLPLFLVLNRIQMRAVLTHELAHLAGGDTGRGATLLRFVESLGEELGASPPGSLSPLRLWAWLGHRIGRRLAGPLALGQELRADDLAARVAGPAATTSALLNVMLAQAFFHETVASMEAMPTRPVYHVFRELWSRTSSAHQQFLRSIIHTNQPTSRGHPDLRHRIRRIREGGHDDRHRPGDADPADTLLHDPPALERLHQERISGIAPLESTTFHRAGT